jgi:hypothetical protein
VKPLSTYFLKLELFFFGSAFLLAALYYFVHGTIPAIRIFFGSLIAVHLGLAWAFRASILAATKRLFKK